MFPSITKALWMNARRAMHAGSILARLVYRHDRYIVVYGALTGPPVPDRVGDVVLRVATPSDLARLDDLDDHGRGKTHRLYVERDNDWLFVACHGDRIVATRRLSLTVRDGLMSRVVRLKPGQVWACHVFCLPDYRNQGIGRHLQLFGDRYLAAIGYTGRFGSIVSTNAPSIRIARYSGSRPCYDVSHTRVLCFERLRVSEETTPARALPASADRPAA